MVLIHGEDGQLSAIKINPYHELIDTVSEDHAWNNVICNGNTGAPIYTNPDGSRCFRLPGITPLARSASNTTPAPAELKREISYPKHHGLPKTSFEWRRGLHVLFGNILGEVATKL